MLEPDPNRRLHSADPALSAGQRHLHGRERADQRRQPPRHPRRHHRLHR